MLKNILLSIVIFAVVLIALTFGEKTFNVFAEWLYELTGIAVMTLQPLYMSMQGYVLDDQLKNNGAKLNEEGTPRKIAIILAIFLGWLGVHRFYLNQLITGLLYLIISQIFLPLAVILSPIDAVRYYSMSEVDFQKKFKP